MNHKIIVESFNDQAIYSYILNNYCTSKADIETISDSLDWVDLGGLSPNALIIKLKDIKSDIFKASTSLKIGVIIDIDEASIEDRLKLLNEACSSAFGIEITIEQTNDFQTFIIKDENHDDFDFKLAYCLAGLDGQGELEHILKEIADITSSHHANCLETGWIQCLKAKEISIDTKQLRKLWMDFYKRLDCLDAQQARKASDNVRWKRFLELHGDKFDFNKNLKELNEIKSFLNQFCS